MAAYAALLTLMHTIEQIQQHPRPPISLDQNQVISLTQKLIFLQEFLEGYSHGRKSSNEAAAEMESRIADAARAAQDIIESHLVDQIFAEQRRGEKIIHERLQKVVDDMDLIKQKVMDEMKEMTTTPLIQHSRDDSTLTRSWTSLKGRQNVVVVGDDVLNEMLDKLTGEDPMRQIVPISGMGGIGKTTLAAHVYSHPLIQEHFDVCAWATISQQYNLRQIFVQILSQTSSELDLLEKSENDLKEKLYKFLVGRRYLIILDDVWDVEVWDKIRFFFPDSNTGSRVVITTRLSSLASQVNNGSYCLKMKFLDEVESWNLFRKVVFGEENCHILHHLKQIGKKIARGCKGLPLSICVVGGVLAKSKDEVEYWEYVLENLNSVVNLEDKEHCLKLLHLSYGQLPAHLKPCFLHMGVFAEDEKIRVSKLVELWVGEGFVKPNGGKALEVVAKEYFSELIERNLISVHSLGSVGAIKYCNIHDLLRDFCLRQAQKERFEVVTKQLHDLNIPQHRGSTIHDRHFLLDHENHGYVFRSLQHASSLFYYYWKYPQLPNSRLLRLWKKWHQSFRLRYGYSMLPFNRMHDWMAKSEIWNMPHLRHVGLEMFELPDPPREGDDDIVLGNLQMLSRIKNFKCNEEMIKRILNIKKLRIAYTFRWDDQEASLHFIHNIDRLCKLESFQISFLPEPIFWQSLTFPNSLKKLSIQHFSAEEVLDKMGALPHLVKLKLFRGVFNEGGWETVEGQFRSLRFLQLKECYKLEWWKTESSHFPRLEHLTLWDLQDLKEIPSDIGDIPTLGVIRVRVCCDSIVTSAKKIQEEQEDLGNEDLQVLI